MRGPGPCVRGEVAIGGRAISDSERHMKARIHGPHHQSWKHYWVWWAGKIKVFCFLTGRWMDSDASSGGYYCKAAMNTPYTCGASYIHSKTPRPLYAFTHSSLQLRPTILLCSCIEEALMQAYTRAYITDGVTYVSNSSEHCTAHHRTACA